MKEKVVNLRETMTKEEFNNLSFVAKIPKTYVT